MIATIHSDDRTGLLAAALVAGGLAATGGRPTVVAVAANGAQACGLARLAGPFDLLRPDPRDVATVMSGLATRRAGDVVAVLPTDLLGGNGTDRRDHVRLVATACRLTAAQALHANVSGAWHLRCDDGPGHPAWRKAPRVLPLRLPRLSPLEQVRLLAGDLDAAARDMAVALTATLLALSADPHAERFEAGDLAALLASADVDGNLRERLLDCAAALGDPRPLATPFGIAGRASARVRSTHPEPAPARPRATQPARLRA
ncbi:hypothetical protein ABC766_08580 [Methylobacterium fujisawaense]|uniref:hypothetical protein n=1 Tax=Methylobacterium fujisawaense TaxID=107400 RepID=UPI0031F51CDA